MQDCPQGMGACSNRTCQFPSFPPPNPGIGGIGHTTDRCITAIKPYSKSINEMTSFIGLPGLPSLQQVTTGLLHLFAFDVEKRHVESSISESIISLSHCWLYLSIKLQIHHYEQVSSVSTQNVHLLCKSHHVLRDVYFHQQNHTQLLSRMASDMSQNLIRKCASF